jgi:hypothetical protein
VIAQDLQRDNIQNTLQTVYNIGDTDGFSCERDRVVIVVADDDGLGLAGGNLGESRLDWEGGKELGTATRG